jgi:nitrogen fixation protein FixH
MIMNGSGLAPPSDSRWRLLILLLVGGFLVFSAWTFYRAGRESSAVVDSDYYSHGLRFDQTLLEQNAAAALGWQLHAELAGRQLRLALADQQLRPVTAAHGTLTVRNGLRGAAWHLALSEERDGSYRCQLPDALRGEQTAQVTFTRDGATIVRQLLLALP